MTLFATHRRPPALLCSGLLLLALGASSCGGDAVHYEARIGNQSIDPDQLFNGSSGLYFAR